MENQIVSIDALKTQLDDKTIELNQKIQELSSFIQGAKAVLEHKGFVDSARSIFDFCKDLTGATSGYVALLSDDGQENEVLFSGIRWAPMHSR